MAAIVGGADERDVEPQPIISFVINFCQSIFANIVFQRPSFKEIVRQLDSIIPEVEKLEFKTKLLEQIQNQDGADWWASRVRGCGVILIFDFLTLFNSSRASLK